MIIFMYLQTAARLTGTNSVVELTFWSWWIIPVSVATSTLAAVVARFALPVGHDAASGLDHSDRGLHVIGLQARLDHPDDARCASSGR